MKLFSLEVNIYFTLSTISNMNIRISLNSKQGWGVILVLIIIGSSLFAFLSSEDKINIGEYISDLKNSSQEFKSGFSADIDILNNSLYKGEFLAFVLKIEIKDSIALVKHIVVNITDGNRVAGQKIIINQTMIPGKYSINLDLKPSFDQYGFIALNYGIFTIIGFSVNYRQRQIEDRVVAELNDTVSVLPWPEYEQFGRSRCKQTGRNNSTEPNQNGDHCRSG